MRDAVSNEPTNLLSQFATPATGAASFTPPVGSAASPGAGGTATVDQQAQLTAGERATSLIGAKIPCFGVFYDRCTGFVLIYVCAVSPYPEWTQTQFNRWYVLLRMPRNLEVVSFQPGLRDIVLLARPYGTLTEARLLQLVLDPDTRRAVVRTEAWNARICLMDPGTCDGTFSNSQTVAKFLGDARWGGALRGWAEDMVCSFSWNHHESREHLKSESRNFEKKWWNWRPRFCRCRDGSGDGSIVGFCRRFSSVI